MASSRRTLVSRHQRDEVSSPAHRSGRPSEGSHRQSTALPPYQPPSCPLTARARLSLASLSVNAENRKYEQHMKAAIDNITSFAAESNDRLYDSKEALEKLAKKRLEADEVAEKTEQEIHAEERAKMMEKKVGRITAESEKALREVIDLQMQFAEQPTILQSVADQATASAEAADQVIEARKVAIDARRNKRRRPKNDSDDEDQEDDQEEAEVPQNEAQEMLDISGEVSFRSPVEILKEAREQYTATYNAQDMYTRYATHNAYRGFKRVVHDAHNPGDNAPPVPHPSTWFSDEAAASNTPAARRRRMASRTDNTENGDDDDEIVVTGETASLKCPLTLRTFEQPYSNHICKHTFEKAAIMQLHRETAVAFVDPSQGRRGRGVPQGPKQMKCPSASCDAMIELKDFYDDQIILRQVKRQAAMEEAEMQGDETEDDEPAGTQMPRTKIRGRGSSKIEHESPQTLPKEEKSGRKPRKRPAVTPDESEDDDPEPIDMDE